MGIVVQGAVPLFQVYDVPTAVAFYRDGLGFEVVTHSPPFTSAKDDFGWALLRLQGVELMLNNMYENNVRPAERDAARTASHGDPTLYVACLKDPDGYSICFQCPSQTQIPFGSND
jgi:glyoxylase I family protein